jgi:hypothetical protein
VRREAAIRIDFLRRKRQHLPLGLRLGPPFEGGQEEPQVLDGDVEVAIAGNDDQGRLLTRDRRDRQPLRGAGQPSQARRAGRMHQSCPVDRGLQQSTKRKRLGSRGHHGGNFPRRSNPKFYHARRRFSRSAGRRRSAEGERGCKIGQPSGCPNTNRWSLTPHRILNQDHHAGGSLAAFRRCSCCHCSMRRRRSPG